MHKVISMIPSNIESDYILFSGCRKMQQKVYLNILQMKTTLHLIENIKFYFPELCFYFYNRKIAHFKKVKLCKTFISEKHNKNDLNLLKDTLVLIHEF